MSYIKKNLMPDETIVYEAKIHPYIYIPSFIVFCFSGAVYLAQYLEYLKEINILFFYIPSGTILLLGLKSFFSAYVFRNSTELVVTSRRIVTKFGIIKRDTTELSHNKIEGLVVHQTVLQRLFDAGTLIIQGVGGGQIPIRNIDAPFTFRTNAMSVIDNS